MRSIANNTSTYVSSFSPVLGGRYYNSSLGNEDDRGFWWGSEGGETYASRRRRIFYDGNNLSTAVTYRHDGFYIRCINKQKTVLDLTYMQEMNAKPLGYFLGLVDYRKASI